MAPPPPPEMIDDAIAEILLRLPPGEPHCLFRASLVCKPWRRLLTDAAFLRRYRRFHRTPPLLGLFFVGQDRVEREICPLFIPTTSASPFAQPILSCRPWVTLDCRHGLVLLQRMEGGRFIVWDPGARRSLFPIGDNDFVSFIRGAHAGDGVYFMLGMGARILKYDLVKHHVSIIDPPESYNKGIFMVPTEDGLLGVAGIKGTSLYLWSRKVNAEGVEGWMQYRVIELQTLFPDDKLLHEATVIAFAEGVRVIFMDTCRGVSMIDLNKLRAGEDYCACGKLLLPAETN